MRANAPLIAEGRRRLVARVLAEARPQAHGAVEYRLARATVRKWVGRFARGGGVGRPVQPAAPHRSPTRAWWRGAGNGSSRPVDRR